MSCWRETLLSDRKEGHYYQHCCRLRRIILNETEKARKMPVDQLCLSRSWFKGLESVYGFTQPISIYRFCIYKVLY